MPRLSNDDMGRVLAEAVRAAGGDVSHADLEVRYSLPEPASVAQPPGALTAPRPF